MRQLTGTEAGTLSGLLSYGTYVLDFRLNGTLCAGIMRPECRLFKCMELTHLSQTPCSLRIFSSLQAQCRIVLLLQRIFSSFPFFCLLHLQCTFEGYGNTNNYITGKHSKYLIYLYLRHNQFNLLNLFITLSLVRRHIVL